QPSGRGPLLNDVYRRLSGGRSPEIYGAKLRFRPNISSKVFMRSLLDLGRRSLTLAAVLIQAGCATATRGTAVSSGTTTRPSGEHAQTLLPKGALIRADSAYQAGAYPLSTSLYEAIVTRDPSPASIAIFRLATLRSWDNRLDEAVALYRRYINQEPRDAEGRIALARTLAWQGNYASAIATYDSLIANRQRTRDATLDRAQT